MIAFLKGILHAVSNDSVVVEVNGVGYRVQVPLSLLPGLPGPGRELLLHTMMVVREDAITLYGFDTVSALEVFRLLLNVSGVGPKGALSLLSVMTPGGLSLAIRGENTGLLSKAPGIGKKTAQRIILELKDKFSPVDEVLESSEDVLIPMVNNNDAIEALISLGFSPAQGALAVSRVVKEAGSDIPLGEIVRRALKTLGG